MWLYFPSKSQSDYNVVYQRFAQPCSRELLLSAAHPCACPGKQNSHSPEQWKPVRAVSHGLCLTYPALTQRSCTSENFKSVIQSVRRSESAISFFSLQNKLEIIEESPQKNAVLDPWVAEKTHKQKIPTKPHTLQNAGHGRMSAKTNTLLASLSGRIWDALLLNPTGFLWLYALELVLL